MLVITPRYVNQTPIVIRIDGRFTDDALKGMPFNADLERRILNQLTAMQVSIISIWSYDWWRDANAETQKLKDAIAECDKPYL
jgi:predicted GNAT family acetyltransferase